MDFLIRHQDNRKELMSDFVKVADSEDKTPQYKLHDKFTKDMENLTSKHQKFLDSTFESLINNPHPLFKKNYWGDFETSEVKDYDTIHRYSKLSKYQLAEFEAEHKISSVDKVVASLVQTKPQYNFMVKFIQKSKLLYYSYKTGIKRLLEAKEIFESTIPQHIVLVKYLLNSGYIPNPRFFNSKFKDSLLAGQNPFDEIWKVKVEKRNILADLKDCPIFGKNASKLIKKVDRVWQTEVNHYYLP